LFFLCALCGSALSGSGLAGLVNLNELEVAMIEEKLYREIRARLPIACVDLRLVLNQKN